MDLTQEPPARAWLEVGLLALALYAAHAIWFGTWMIDDAGISLAYARSLAGGHGFAPQPGSPSVEGFSNPLWTLAFALLFRLGLVQLPWAPKLLSLLLVGATYLLLLAPWRRSSRMLWVAALAPLLLSLNTSFVAWTTSGLENALNALLIVVLATLSLRALEPGGPDARDVASGIVAGLAALTRPDSILYAAAYPVVVTAGAPLRSLPRRLGRYLAGLLPVLGAWLAVRLVAFGDWLPNTYRAKGGPTPESLLDVAKLADLGESVLGPLAAPFLLALLVAARAGRGRAWDRHLVLGGYLLIALAIYLLLPEDWMGEYRFATPAFVFLYWLGAELLAESKPAAAAVVSAAIVLETLAVYVPRSRAFAANPPVPFEQVRAFAGVGYNRVASALGVREASLLTPDVGGGLIASDLRIHDLAGLCDPVIARTLGSDHAAFLDYVFGVLRPTFIHVHGSWLAQARLDEDPRLARDYLALREGTDYVRRDAAAGPSLERARAAFRAAGMGRMQEWKGGGRVSDERRWAQARP